MTAIVLCSKKESNHQNSLALSEFIIEFKRPQLYDGSIHKYKILDYEYELVWALKKKVNSRPELILESCTTNDVIINITIFFRNSKYAYDDAYDISETLIPEDLVLLPYEVTELTFNSPSVNEIKIIFKVYSPNKNVFKSLDMIAKNYGCLLRSEESADITIIVGSEKFAAHKLILSTRSMVFDAMFNTDMVEKQKNVVEIKDIELVTFKLLLEFIYTGKINTNEKNAQINWFELMSAADKYAIDSLKSVCAQNLAENLSTDNVVDIYVLADCLNEKKLKVISADYIIANKSKIVGTEKYEEMTRNHVQAAMELFSKLMLN